jgi:uncharacterized membrane protein
MENKKMSIRGRLFWTIAAVTMAWLDFFLEYHTSWHHSLIPLIFNMVVVIFVAGMVAMALIRRHRASKNLRAQTKKGDDQ